MSALKVILTGMATFVLMDFLWLGIVARGFYKNELASLGRFGPDGSMTPLWSAAVPVYVLLALGVYAFVLPRADTASWTAAAGWGAAFGLVVYGTYDLTNLATLRTYSLNLTVVDMAWGAVINATASVVMQAAARYFGA